MDRVSFTAPCDVCGVDAEWLHLDLSPSETFQAVRVECPNCGKDSDCQTKMIKAIERGVA